MVEIKFKTGNQAFDEFPEFEIARILGEISGKICDGRTYGSVIDINGNKIGEWKYVSR